QASAQLAGSLFHRRQTEMLGADLGAVWFEARSIVADLQPQAFIIAVKSHGYPLRAGVGQRIVERLLGDPQDGDVALHAIGRRTAGLERDLRAVDPLEHLDLLSQRGV